MSIEEELWCIFTNYTLKSNPMEPATLPSRQFLKLARETQLAVTARDLADAHIAISSQLSVGETFRRLGRKGKALTYSDFVAVLFQLAPKCHPSVDASFAFQKVLLENVLPLAQRRSVYSVESVLAEDEIKDLLGRQFARGIDGIFDWCVTMANSSQHAADRGGTNCFDARHNARIGYTEFLKFCETFKIFEGQVSRVDALLSVRAVGDVYLAATRKRNAYVSGASPPCVQDMTRSDFDEALVRIALHAYCRRRPRCRRWRRAVTPHLRRRVETRNGCNAPHAGPSRSRQRRWQLGGRSLLNEAKVQRNPDGTWAEFTRP